MIDKKYYVYENSNLAVLCRELENFSCCAYCRVYPKREKFILQLLEKSRASEKLYLSKAQKDWLDTIIWDHYIKHCSQAEDEGRLPDYDSIFGKYI